MEVHVNGGGATNDELLHGYRSALRLSIGLCGLGLCLAIVFLLKSYWADHKSLQNTKREAASKFGEE